MITSTAVDKTKSLQLAGKKRHMMKSVSDYRN